MGVRRGLLFFSLLAFSFLLTAATSKAQDAQQIEASWPREIESSLGKIVIYQPQLDTLEGNVVNGRAAVSLQGPEKKDPLFGAIWFRSEISVDRDAGLVTVEDTKILRSKFPDATPEDLQKFQDIVDTEINKWDMVMTLEQVQASLSASQKEVASTENLKSDPPVIIFSQKPAVLVSFGGEPETRAIESKHSALSFGFTSGPTEAGIKSFKKTWAFAFSIEDEIPSRRRTVVTVSFLAVSAGSSIATPAPNPAGDVA